MPRSKPGEKVSSGCRCEGIVRQLAIFFPLMRLGDKIWNL